MRKKEKLQLQIEERDWIIIRLLYLLLQDTSNINLKDVRRTIKYLSNVDHLNITIGRNMMLINKEYAMNDMFDSPDAKLARDINKTIQTTLNQLVVKE